MLETQNRKRRGSSAVAPARRERAGIKNYTGALTLFVDDRPCAPLAIDVDTTAADLTQGIKAATDSGVSIVRLALPDLFWRASEELDTSAVLDALKPFNDAPDSLKFIIAVPVDAPVWWLEAHPKERAAYALPRESGRSAVVSWASSLWQQNAGEALDRLLRYILNSSAGKRLIGVQVLAGELGAWIYADTEKLPDVGPCMNAAFIKYTVEKYRRNGGLLRKAWFDTRVEFSSITCPTAAERGKADYGVFRNPHRSRRLMDYYECLANSQVAAALSFCAIVKRASNGALIVGLESAPLTPQTLSPECGHTFPEPLLASPDVDFFVETGASSGAGIFRPYRDSAALNGKFVFVRSAASGDSTAQRAAGEGVGAFVPAPRSNSAIADLTGLGAALEKGLSKPRKMQPQVAVVLDPSASLVVSSRADCAPVQNLMLDQIMLIRKAGLVFSIYSFADMFHAQFPDHKVVLMPNCFYLSEAERRRLDARVKRSGQTAVWFWAPGVIGEESINAESGSKCCGQKMRIEPGGLSLRTRIVISNDPLTWGRHAGDAFAPELPASPACTVADKQATRLGANSANKTSFSVRRFDVWTSVVYGTLPVPLDLLHNLFRGSGCHVYCSTLREGDWLATDGRALTLSSRAGGMYTISLPGQFDVTDLISGKKVAAGANEIPAALNRGQSVVFELKPRSREG